MNISGGNITITESKALVDGGRGGVGRFSAQEDAGSPKKWHAEHHGLCSFGAEASSGARLERFADRCS